MSRKILAGIVFLMFSYFSHGDIFAQVNASPTSLQFGDHLLGQISPTKNVTLTNAGPSTVTISSTTVSGDYLIRSETCGTTLPAGHTCSISIEFLPTVTGNRTGTLMVTDSAPNNPQSVSLDGTGVQGQPRFAYSANFSDNTLSIYGMNPTTGVLLANGYVQTGAGPRGVAVHPNGRFVYTANENSADVSAFVITPNGGLTPVPGSPFSVGQDPISVAIDPAGRFLFVANDLDNTVSAFTITLGNGALKPVPGSPFLVGTNPFAVTTDALGKFVFVANNLSNDVSAFSVNQMTGALKELAGSPLPAGSGPFAVTVDRSEFVYVANQNSNNISAYALNASKGTITSISGSPFSAPGSGPEAIATDPSGKFLYVVEEFSNDVAAFTIKSATGALTPVSGSPYPAGGGPSGLTVDPTGKFVCITLQGQGLDSLGNNSIIVFSIDSTTGGLFGGGGTFAARPEPFGIALSQGTAGITYRPEFAYVANANSNNISGYRVNPTTGVLTKLSGSPFASGLEPLGIAVDPYYRFAIVVNVDSLTVSSYTINSSSGALAAVNSPSTSGAPVYVAVDASGRFAYVLNQLSNGTGNIEEFLIDQSTGALSFASNFAIAVEPTAIALSPSGLFAYVTALGSSASDLYAFTIDPTSGALGSISGSPIATTQSDPQGLVVEPFGQFLYVTAASNSVSTWVADLSTGVPDQIASSAESGGPFSVAVDPTDRFAYVVNGSSSNVSPYAVGGNIGLISLGSPVPTGSGPRGLSIDPSGDFLYVANVGGNSVSAYKIESGSLVAVTGSPFAAGSGAFSIAITGLIK